MSMGAFWLLFILWSYTALPVIKAQGSISEEESLLKIEAKYADLRSYCSTLGLASGKEGITSDRKTTLFVGEYSNLSNIHIVLQKRTKDNKGSVGYSVKCTYPRWKGSGFEDYKKLIQDLSRIIREED